MRKIITIILLLISLFSVAQEKNTVIVTYSPAKNGLGLIFISSNNILATIDKGTYSYYEEPDVDITKVGIGTLIYSYENNSKTYLSLMYNQITNGYELDEEYYNKINNKLIKLSLEVTGLIYFNNTFGASISYDFINFEGRFGFVIRI